MSVYNKLATGSNSFESIESFSKNLQLELSIIKDKVNKKEVDNRNKHLGAEVEFFWLMKKLYSQL